jgi:hypothetical protein
VSRAPVLAAPLPPGDTERLVRLAETRAQAGEHADAARLFEEVVRRPSSPFTDRALVGLTRLLVNPESPDRDYRAAHRVAEQLVREYPESPYASEARAWRDLLASYLVRSQQLEQRRQELDDATRELEGRTRRLREADRELQERTLEVERLNQELKRLKVLDAELERRTQELEKLSYELDRRNKELERLKRLDLELEQQKKKP